MTDTSRDAPVVLLSGANRGIGAAIARELGQNGYRLSLGARDPATLTAAFGEETEAALHARFDALDPASARAWVAATVEKFGRIDVLINNAGTNERVSLLDDDDDDSDAALDRLWSINVKAPLRLTRLCIPHLEKAGRGRIINLVSLSGKRVRNPFVGYSMTKFAMMGLTHTTRHVTWDKGIRATAICPSFVCTDMTAQTTKVTREDMIQPETLAQIVRHTIELPNNAAVAEVLVNCRLEDML